MNVGTTPRPKWEEVQIRCFVSWANFRWSASLKARNRPDAPLIIDINNDLKDGVKAAMLLMVLFNKKIPGIKNTNKFIDSLQNWTLNIAEMRKQGIDFRAGSSDLVAGDLKSTLAFFWALIRSNGSDLIHMPKVSAQGNIGKVSTPTDSVGTSAGPAASGESFKQSSVKEHLIKYFNTYLPMNKQINNFTESFRDGQVLEHLFLNLANIKVKPADNPQELLNNCFVAGHEELYLPFMISAPDLAAGQVKEESVMTYLISLLQGITERSKVPVATQEKVDPTDILGVTRDDVTAASPMPQAQFTTAVVEDIGEPTSHDLRAVSTVSIQPTEVYAGNVEHSKVSADQNFVGAIIQGSVLMELPEIFRIVAYADYKNFLQYWNAHQNELFQIAEPYHINVMFMAARIIPHTTALKFMDFILQQIPNSHLVVDRKGNLPMHEALEYGCRENFDYLFNLPGAPRPALPTLIHASLWPDNTECLEHLLRLFTNGTVPMDVFVHEGHTPLMKFIAIPRPSPALNVLSFLLQRGSNPAYLVPGGVPHTPIVVAASSGKWEEVDCMLRESHYQPLPLTRLLVAFLCVVGVSQETTAQFVSRISSALNLVDPETHRTPLEIAISLARPDLVEILLQYGADVNLPSDQDWRFPIHYALLFYNKDPHKYYPVIQVLQRWGANPLACDCRGMSAVDHGRSLGVQIGHFVPAV